VEPTQATEPRTQQPSTTASTTQGTAHTTAAVRPDTGRTQATEPEQHKLMVIHNMVEPTQATEPRTQQPSTTASTAQGTAHTTAAARQDTGVATASTAKGTAHTTAAVRQETGLATASTAKGTGHTTAAGGGGGRDAGFRCTGCLHFATPGAGGSCSAQALAPHWAGSCGVQAGGSASRGSHAVTRASRSLCVRPSLRQLLARPLDRSAERGGAARRREGARYRERPARTGAGGRP